MVRILCLHGIGTSGNIFSAQTAGFRTLLPPHWEWEFPDSEIECSPSAEVSAIYPPPYLCYFTVPSVTGIQAAYEWVKEIIEEEVPFDGVMGFSAGGGLAAAIVLHHQLTLPFEPRLFRFAIFICAPLPWSIDRSSGIDVTPLVVRDGRVPAEMSDVRRRLAEVRSGAADATSTDIPEGIPDALRSAVNEMIKTNDLPYDSEKHPIRMIHPEIDRIRIDMPTLHILGKHDQVCGSSHKLIQMCDERHVNVYEHGGGHEVSRTVGDLQKIRDLILKTVARSELV